MAAKTSFTHAQLVLRARLWLLNKMNCRFALCEINALTGECADAIGWKYSHQSHVVEVKVSRADFFRDQRKRFRQKPELGMGCFRWLMLPTGLVSVDDMRNLPGWGLLYVRGRSVQIIRKAEPQSVVNLESEVCVLVQAVANAQLCAQRDLNELFADPESVVGRTRAQRRALLIWQKEQAA